MTLNKPGWGRSDFCDPPGQLGGLLFGSGSISIRIFWLPVFSAKSFKSLALPTGRSASGKKPR
jgi:hypothetical protein